MYSDMGGGILISIVNHGWRAGRESRKLNNFLKGPSKRPIEENLEKKHVLSLYILLNLNPE